MVSINSVQKSRYLLCNFFLSFWPQNILVILFDLAFSIIFSKQANFDTRYSYEGIFLFQSLIILVSLKFSFYASTAESGKGYSNFICPIGKIKDSLLIGVDSVSFRGQRQWVSLIVNAYFSQLKSQLRLGLSISTEYSERAYSSPQKLTLIFILLPLAKAKQYIVSFSSFFRYIFSSKQRRECLKVCSWFLPSFNTCQKRSYCLKQNQWLRGSSQRFGTDLIICKLVLGLSSLFDDFLIERSSVEISPPTKGLIFLGVSRTVSSSPALAYAFCSFSVLDSFSLSLLHLDLTIQISSSSTSIFSLSLQKIIDSWNGLELYDFSLFSIMFQSSLISSTRDISKPVQKIPSLMFDFDCKTYNFSLICLLEFQCVTVPR